MAKKSSKPKLSGKRGQIARGGLLAGLSAVALDQVIAHSGQAKGAFPADVADEALVSEAAVERSVAELNPEIAPEQEIANLLAEQVEALEPELEASAEQVAQSAAQSRDAALIVEGGESAAAATAAESAATATAGASTAAASSAAAAGALGGSSLLALGGAALVSASALSGGGSDSAVAQPASLTPAPTAAPTQAPTAAPTQAPTAAPTEAPTVTKKLSVVDGPINNAKVYYDRNGDGVAQDDEFLGRTNPDGSFDAKYTPVPGGRFIVVSDEETTDAFTGNRFSLMLMAGDNGSVVSPISTLLASGAITEAQLKAALGLPADLDLANFNFVEALQKGDPAMLAAAQKMAASAVAMGNVIESALKTAQGFNGQVSGADLQALTSKAFASAAQVIAKMPAGSSLADITQAASTLAQAALIDPNFNLAAKLDGIPAGGLNLDALGAIELPASAKAIIEASASELASISTQLADLFSKITNAADLASVLGDGGAFDRLEDASSNTVDNFVKTLIPTESPTQGPTEGPTQAPQTVRAVSALSPADQANFVAGKTSLAFAGGLGATDFADLNGFSFAEALDVSVALNAADGTVVAGMADGTIQLNTSLAGLAGLGIDHISGGTGVHGVHVAGGLGTKDLAGLGGADGFSFAEALNVSVALNAGDDFGMTDGTIQLNTSLSGLADLGIDHITAAGGTQVEVLGGVGDLAKLQGFSFADNLGVTVHLSDSDKQSIGNGPVSVHDAVSMLSLAGVDQISLGTADVGLGDIAALIDAGLSFAATDAINLTSDPGVMDVTGTQLGADGITLDDLANLGVDTVDPVGTKFEIKLQDDMTAVKDQNDLETALKDVLDKFHGHEVFAQADQVTLKVEGNYELKPLSNALLDEITTLGIDFISNEAGDLDLHAQQSK